MKSNVYHPNCPSRIVLDIISNKWVILIILKLSQGTLRFGELKREVMGISPKVLTYLLKNLEENKLIIRHSYSEVVLRVEYSLTPLGISLSEVCKKITDWAEENVTKLHYKE